MSSPQPYRATAAMTVAIFVGITGLLDIAVKADGEEASGDLIQRIVAQTTRGSVALRAIRELLAGTQTGKHVGWMQVDTVTSPTGGFSWKVIEVGGSERTRNTVFRELLDAEAQTVRTGYDDAAHTVTRQLFPTGLTPATGAPVATQTTTYDNLNRATQLASKK